MSPINELTEIVADAQNHALATWKEAANLSGRIFQTNLDLTERFLAYQRGAAQRFAGPAEQSK
jgi:hypothetical protein